MAIAASMDFLSNKPPIYNVIIKDKMMNINIKMENSINTITYKRTLYMMIGFSRCKTI